MLNQATVIYVAKSIGACKKKSLYNQWYNFSKLHNIFIYESTIIIPLKKMLDETEYSANNGFYLVASVP
jgi:hypothetical protein